MKKWFLAPLILLLCLSAVRARANIYVGCMVTETINVEEEIIVGNPVVFEKLEIQSGICIWNATTFNWDIALKMKNTGTATATLIGVFINDVEIDNYTLDTPARAQIGRKCRLLSISIPIIAPRTTRTREHLHAKLWDKSQICFPEFDPVNVMIYVNRLTPLVSS